MLKRVSVLLVACLMPSVLWSKCAASAIFIEGLISGRVDGFTISIQVDPDPNWDSQPKVAVDPTGHFSATVYFDRTEPGERERCSRKPRTVTVRLEKNGHAVDQKTLQIKSDFVTKSKIDYAVRAPVVLHSQ